MIAENINRTHPPAIECGITSAIIDFCNNERIQTKTSLTPLEKRRQAAFIFARDCL